jgi:YVTN family beta-propeller protein
VNVNLTRMLCAAVAGIALTAPAVALAGAAGVAGRAARVPAPAGGSVPVTAYVASGFFHGTVTPIRTATNTALKAIAVGSDPGAMVITPDGKAVYVIDSGGNHVTPVRTATNTALKAIRVGENPAAIAVTPDGRTSTSRAAIRGR